MEYYWLIIILVVLALVLIAVFRNWFKLLYQKLKPPQPIEQPQKLEINGQKRDERYKLMESPVMNGSESSLGPLTKIYELKKFSYDVMEISENKVSYYKSDDGKKKMENIFLLKYDGSFNESIFHYEITENNTMKIYQEKSNLPQPEEPFDAERIKFPVNVHSDSRDRKYNQIFEKGPLNFKSQATIDAFALYLNLEEEKIYLQNKERMKRIWFAQSITMKNRQFIKNVGLQLKNEFWEFSPINYELQIFCSQVFFVINDDDKKYLVQVAFLEYVTIHDTQPNTQEYYQIIVDNLKVFFKDLKYAVICPNCRVEETSFSNGLELCQKMLQYSDLLDRQKINTTEQMKQYLEKLFKMNNH